MKLRLMLIAFAILLLPGCSLVEQVNSSLNYAQEATGYIEQATQFAEQVPELAQQAATDPEAAAQLVSELQAMNERIASFNGIEVPAFAEDIHEQLQQYNETITTEINGYLEQAGAGAADWATLLDSPLVQTIQEMAALLDQIESLGQ